MNRNIAILITTILITTFCCVSLQPRPSYCPYLVLKTKNHNTFGQCCIDDGNTKNTRQTIIDVEEAKEDDVLKENLRIVRVNGLNLKHRNCSRKVPLKGGSVKGKCCVYKEKLFNDDEVVVKEEDVVDGVVGLRGMLRSRHFMNVSCNAGYVVDANGDCIEAFLD